MGCSCPMAASNPADTMTMSGWNSVAIGMTTDRKAAKYSASPIGRGSRAPVQATFTLKPSPAPEIKLLVDEYCNWKLKIGSIYVIQACQRFSTAARAKIRR